MMHLQQREFAKCVALLRGMGCTFAIKDPDGNITKHGLEVAEPVPLKPKRAPRKYERNAVRDYVAPFFDYNAEVGVVQQIPIGSFERNSLRSSMCSRLSRLWGNETYTSHMTDTHFEVMRTA